MKDSPLTDPAFAEARRRFKAGDRVRHTVRGWSGTVTGQDGGRITTRASRQDQFDNARPAAPRLAMSADSVANALDISVTTLQQLITEGKIPKPFSIPGHPRLVRWDPEDVKTIVREWKELANPGTDGDWNDVR